MGIEDPRVIDFVGTEMGSNVEVLTIADAWDWSDEQSHLLALQAKINAYFEFVESGQLLEERPGAAGRPCRIDILSRHPFPPHLAAFIEAARRAASELGVGVRQRDIGELGSTVRAPEG